MHSLSEGEKRLCVFGDQCWSADWIRWLQASICCWLMQFQGLEERTGRLGTCWRSGGEFFGEL